MSNYTGPTSGRITIGSEGIISRETFTRETDPPLTKDERAATEWFEALGPNEQRREVRRLKWNEAVQRAEAETWKRVAAESNDKIVELEHKLAQITPEGYKIPKAAADLLSFAKVSGWQTGRAWAEHDDMDGPWYRLAIRVQGSWTFDLAWAVFPDGSGHMIRSGLAREGMGQWRDAPSLVKIKKIIEERMQ